MCLKLIGIHGIPLIKKGDNLSSIIIKAIDDDGFELFDEDIIVIAETAISKSEGSIIDLNSKEPSELALELSKKTGKDARLVEAIIEESNEIVKVGRDFIISETQHGFVCANAGIDESNVEFGLATPIPIDPDSSARIIREEIENKLGIQVAVVISDTQGRPFREGAVGVAIGISGISAVWNRQGEKDLYGRELQTTEIAIADELAASASIVMGQADEGIPVVVVRGVDYFKKLRDESATSKQLIRPKKFDVFR